MSQHDFDITTQDANTGTSVRAALNAALQALASNSGGDTAPTVPYKGMWWLDTTNKQGTDNFAGCELKQYLGNDIWQTMFILGTGAGAGAQLLQGYAVALTPTPNAIPVYDENGVIQGSAAMTANPTNLLLNGAFKNWSGMRLNGGDGTKLPGDDNYHNQTWTAPIGWRSSGNGAKLDRDVTTKFPGYVSCMELFTDAGDTNDTNIKGIIADPTVINSNFAGRLYTATAKVRANEANAAKLYFIGTTTGGVASIITTAVESQLVDTVEQLTKTITVPADIVKVEAVLECVKSTNERHVWFQEVAVYRGPSTYAFADSPADLLLFTSTENLFKNTVDFTATVNNTIPKDWKIESTDNTTTLTKALSRELVQVHDNFGGAGTALYQPRLKTVASFTGSPVGGNPSVRIFQTLTGFDAINAQGKPFSLQADVYTSALIRPFVRFNPTNLFGTASTTHYGNYTRGKGSPDLIFETAKFTAMLPEYYSHFAVEASIDFGFEMEMASGASTTAYLIKPMANFGLYPNHFVPSPVDDSDSRKKYATVTVADGTDLYNLSNIKEVFGRAEIANGSTSIAVDLTDLALPSNCVPLNPMITKGEAANTTNDFTILPITNLTNTGFTINVSAASPSDMTKVVYFSFKYVEYAL